MNTKLIMSASAFILGLVGMLLTFIPKDLIIYFGLEPIRFLELILQILGALYFGFAMLNWMARTSIIGGIYNKPLVVANCAHFFIAGMALLKYMISITEWSALISIITFIYVAFAIAFIMLFFKTLRQQNQNNGKY